MRAVICILIFLSGCKTTAFFVSPNEVHKENVVLYLKNQEKISGIINIDLENGSGLHTEFKPIIEIMPEGKTTWQRFNITDITAYTMGSDYFPVKDLDVDLNGTHFLLFVKRMTAENSKIQLYEQYESGKGNSTGESKYSYFLSFPGFGPLETINAKSSRLVPNFDSKMSNMVDDCPALAKKIRSRQKDYFLAMGTFNIKKTPEVLMRIINDYNNCN
jgi:hypothetical protein